MAKLNKEISVMLPRETAEEIIKRAELHDTTNTKTPFLANIEGLARAYLELEKKLSLEQQDRESEKREFKVFKDAAENEITKLKADNEYLLRQYADEISGLCDDKRFKKIIELESEITKLKEENKRFKIFMEHEFKIKEKYVSEITKLKEENEKQCEINLDLWNEIEQLKTVTINDLTGSLSKANIENDKLSEKLESTNAEKEKLKKSRGVLRKFVDHCCSWNEGEVVTGLFDSPWTAREAREALKADDEIMKGE